MTYLVPAARPDRPAGVSWTCGEERCRPRPVRDEVGPPGTPPTRVRWHATQSQPPTTAPRYERIDVPTVIAGEVRQLIHRCLAHEIRAASSRIPVVISEVMKRRFRNRRPFRRRAFKRHRDIESLPARQLFPVAITLACGADAGAITAPSCGCAGRNAPRPDSDSHPHHRMHGLHGLHSLSRAIRARMKVGPLNLRRACVVRGRNRRAASCACGKTWAAPIAPRSQIEQPRSM